MIYLELFWSFFQVGLFSFGGGYAALPLIQDQVVYLNHWLSLSEFTDLITISQLTPGPIAINSATFVGTRIAGLGGALIATLACILPACIIVSVLAWLYFKYKNLTLIQGILGGLRPTIVALIATAGLSIIVFAFWGEAGASLDFVAIDLVALGIFSAGLLVMRTRKINPLYVILASGVVGGFIYLLI